MGGGSNGDNGASAIAEANSRAAREAAQAEQARWEREQQRLQQEKEAEKQRLQTEEAKRQQELEYQRQEAARQAEAQQKTGIPSTSFLDTRTDKAKAFAAASAGLPGFGDLKKKAMVATPMAGSSTGAFSGQGNLPLSAFNLNQTGGRRYT